MLKANRPNEATRRAFLQTCAAGLGVAGLSGAWASADSATSAPPAPPAFRLEADPKRCLIPVVSWDTEGGDRTRTSLLRSGTGIGLRVRVEGQWIEGTDLPATVQAAGGGTRYLIQASRRTAIRWDISQSQDGFTVTLAAEVRELSRPEVWSWCSLLIPG
jgi:hypothetical protein